MRNNRNPHCISHVMLYGAVISSCHILPVLVACFTHPPLPSLDSPIEAPRHSPAPGIPSAPMIGSLAARRGRSPSQLTLPTGLNYSIPLVCSHMYIHIIRVYTYPCLPHPRSSPEPSPKSYPRAFLTLYLSNRAQTNKILQLLFLLRSPAP